jgi:uncharacterized protein YndB with AHSA1/START domain
MRLTCSYPVPLDEVWAALTEPARWFGVLTGEGPEYRVHRVGAAAPTALTVRECAAPHRLVVELPEEEHPWRPTVELAEQGEGTLLTFLLDLPEDYPILDAAAAWNFYLDRLGAVLMDSPMPGEEPVVEPAAAAPKADLFAELERAAELRDRGIIDADEFAAIKKAAIARYAG